MDHLSKNGPVIKLLGSEFEVRIVDVGSIPTASTLGRKSSANDVVSPRGPGTTLNCQVVSPYSSGDRALVS